MSLHGRELTNTSASARIAVVRAALRMDPASFIQGSAASLPSEIALEINDGAAGATVSIACTSISDEVTALTGERIHIARAAATRRTPIA